jgi:hypothetical protein
VGKQLLYNSPAPAAWYLLRKKDNLGNTRMIKKAKQSVYLPAAGLAVRRPEGSIRGV